MKKLLPILVLLCALVSRADTVTTATISFTNAAGTTNGQTITINAAVRTWTNSVVVPGTQILTNATPSGSATNAFNQISLNPFAGISLSYSSSTSLALRAFPNQSLTVTLSAGYGEVAYQTATLTPSIAVRTPYTTETPQQITNISSDIVAKINNNANTNAIAQTSLAASQLAGLGNNQTITGNKTFTGTVLVSNETGIFHIGTLYSTNINGIIGAISNGIWRTGALIDPVLTNALWISSANSHMTNLNAYTTVGDVALKVWPNPGGSSVVAFPDDSTGWSWNAAIDNTFTLGHGVFPSLGAEFRTNRVTFRTPVAITGGGLTSENGATNLWLTGTNSFPAGSDISFGRYPITSLANGANAAVPVGTNVFVEVSGPSGAFSIDGINGAPNRDGKLIVILNQTGQDMTVKWQSGGDPTAANRIITMTGADRTTTGNGAATFIYSSAASRWILTSFDP